MTFHILSYAHKDHRRPQYLYPQLYSWYGLTTGVSTTHVLEPLSWGCLAGAFEPYSIFGYV